MNNTEIPMTKLTSNAIVKEIKRALFLISSLLK